MAQDKVGRDVEAFDAWHARLAEENAAELDEVVEQIRREQAEQAQR